MSLEIGRLEASEIDDLFEFRARVFPEGPRRLDRKYWNWQYLENPDAGGQIPVWVIRTEGRIAGSIAVVPTRAKVGDAVCLALSGHDYFVEKEFLGLPSLRLLKAVLAESPLNIMANISESARRLFAKMGYVELSGHLAWTSVPLRLERASLGGKGYLKQSFLRGARRVLLPGPFQTEITGSVPADTQPLWDKICATRRVTLIKDVSYLGWRYELCPTQDYLFIALRRGGKLRALAVVTEKRWGEGAERLGVIMDLLVPDHDRLAVLWILGACLEYFEAQGCRDCFTHVMNEGTRRLFSLIGFHHGPSDLGMMVFTPENGEDCFKAARDPASWSYFLGDTDRI